MGDGSGGGDGGGGGSDSSSDSANDTGGFTGVAPGDPSAVSGFSVGTGFGDSSQSGSSLSGEGFGPDADAAAAAAAVTGLATGLGSVSDANIGTGIGSLGFGTSSPSTPAPGEGAGFGAPGNPGIGAQTDAGFGIAGIGPTAAGQGLGPADSTTNDTANLGQSIGAALSQNSDPSTSVSPSLAAALASLGQTSAPAAAAAPGAAPPGIAGITGVASPDPTSQAAQPDAVSAVTGVAPPGLSNSTPSSPFGTIAAPPTSMDAELGIDVPGIDQDMAVNAPPPPGVTMGFQGFSPSPTGVVGVTSPTSISDQALANTVATKGDAEAMQDAKDQAEANAIAGKLGLLGPNAITTNQGPVSALPASVSSPPSAPSATLGIGADAGFGAPGQPSIGTSPPSPAAIAAGYGALAEGMSTPAATPATLGIASDAIGAPNQPSLAAQQSINDANISLAAQNNQPNIAPAPALSQIATAPPAPAVTSPAPALGVPAATPALSPVAAPVAEQSITNPDGTLNFAALMANYPGLRQQLTNILQTS